MSTGKNVARERDTRGECERLPESPMEIVYSLSPSVSLSRATFFPVLITSITSCYAGCLGLCVRYAFIYGNAYACANDASEDRALQAKAANNFFIIIEMLILTSLKLKGPNLSLSLFP